MKREFRTYRNVETRAKDGAKGIEGHAAVFNLLSEDLGGFQERILPGAFDRCLGASPDVRCLFNHNPDYLLGRTKSGTLSLDVTEHGLHYDCDTPDTQIGRDVVTSVGRRDIDGSSFGFTVHGQNWLESEDASGEPVIIRELTDVELFDVSPVTFPAYPSTDVSARAMWPDGIPEDVAEFRAKRDSAPEAGRPLDTDRDTALSILRIHFAD